MIVEDTIKEGVVVAVEGSTAKVDIDCAASECDGCKVAMLCSSRKSAVNVDAAIPEGCELSVGDKVIVAGRVKNWLLGWFLIAGLPCIAILLGVFINYWLKLSEVAAGCICLAFLVAYYLGLYAARKWVNRRVEWYVRPDLELRNEVEA